MIGGSLLKPLIHANLHEENTLAKISDDGRFIQLYPLTRLGHHTHASDFMR